jgi:saccharopine dehydrogenase-like protein
MPLHRPPPQSVLILGAYGAFGRRITDALARTTDLPIIAAGRRIPDAPGASDRIYPIAIDAMALGVTQLQALNPRVLIDIAGPFQARDRRLAIVCIGSGIHYIDLADGREFVAGVGVLNASALQHDVLIVSGASTVPALSSAVIDRLAGDFSAIEEIEIGIAPGYLGPRGLATIRSILGYVGRPIPIWRNTRLESAHGWSSGTRHRYPPPAGVRDLSLVDVPDTALLPVRYANLQQLTVRAGIEVPLVHHLLSLLGVLVRHGLISDLARHAKLLHHLAAWFDGAGSDNGAMHVRLRGRDTNGCPSSRTWTLVAEHGDGPQIPATAAVLLAKKLLEVPGYAPLTRRGAMPAVGLLDLQEFEREWLSLAIRTSVTNETG